MEEEPEAEQTEQDQQLPKHPQPEQPKKRAFQQRWSCEQTKRLEATFQTLQDVSRRWQDSQQVRRFYEGEAKALAAEFGEDVGRV